MAGRAGRRGKDLTGSSIINIDAKILGRVPFPDEFE